MVYQHEHFYQAEKIFLTLDALEEFAQAWNGLVAATTIVDYELKLASMHVVFPVVSMRYLDYTCLCIRKILFLFSYEINAIMVMLQRRVWRWLMPLSKNGYLCQPLRWLSFEVLALQLLFFANK